MNCYNEENHACNISCQGACDCPIAHGLNPSRRVMKLYVKKQKEYKKEMEEFMAELDKDEELQERLRKLHKEFIL